MNTGWKWIAIGMVVLIAAVAGVSIRGTTRANHSQKLVIFHAGSLSVPFAQISELFEQEYPGIVVRAEAAGSRQCARKICDLGRQCDVIASADYFDDISDRLVTAHVPIQGTPTF